MIHRCGALAGPRRAPAASVVLSLCAVLATPALQAAGESARALFEAALEDPGAPGQDDPAVLREYLLYPYLQAARLRHALQVAPDAQLDARIGEFLAEHGAQPVTRGLRGAWLLSLAERRRWRPYLDALPEPPDDDLLRCHWLDAQLALGNEAALRAHALDTWLRGRDMPSACNGAFDWLARRGLLSEARYRQRIEAALEAGQPSLARYLARSLPYQQARPLINAALLQETPTTMLDRLMDAPDAPVDWRWIDQAFERIARREVATALSRYDRLVQTRQPDAAQQAALRRWLALGLAYDRDPRALAWFDSLPPAQRDEQTREWHARAALYHGRWARVQRIVEDMPAALAAEARWRYWLARALGERGDAAAARERYSALLAERDPYGFFAAMRLGRAPDLAPRRIAENASAQQQLLQLEGLQRALELRSVDMPGEALAELYWSIADLDEAGRVQAGLLLGELGWYPPSIALLSEARRWDDLYARFPLPYRELVLRAAEKAGLSPDRLYSVMRAESLYDARAISGAGAYGLLQLLPSTAREVAQRNGLPPPSREALLQPEVNIALGSLYLAELDARFGKHFLLVIAAYNAGPYRIPGWLPPQTMDADVWIENIPYNETRAYVMRVLYNIVIFGWRLRGQPGSLADLMQAVPAELEGPGDA